MPSKYLSMRDPTEIAPRIMEGIAPGFGKEARPGDILVAGKNFGCGSSRETAPGELKAFGIGCIIAPTFARIFLRNSINIGLPVLECLEAAREILEGHTVSVDFGAGAITDETIGSVYRATPFPPSSRR
jgi:3-isopropylmalate/(R)-2-methylmalate dehydratase small subunit